MKSATWEVCGVPGAEPGTKQQLQLVKNRYHSFSGKQLAAGSGWKGQITWE